jgi:hypothetical protein
MTWFQVKTSYIAIVTVGPSINKSVHTCEVREAEGKDNYYSRVGVRSKHPKGLDRT